MPKTITKYKKNIFENYFVCKNFLVQVLVNYAYYIYATCFD